ncbi:hypothetical protein ACRTAB_002986 [Clostridium perfringens]
MVGFNLEYSNETIEEFEEIIDEYDKKNKKLDEKVKELEKQKKRDDIYYYCDLDYKAIKGNDLKNEIKKLNEEIRLLENEKEKIEFHFNRYKDKFIKEIELNETKRKEDINNLVKACMPRNKN